MGFSIVAIQNGPYVSIILTFMDTGMLKLFTTKIVEVKPKGNTENALK